VTAARILLVALAAASVPAASGTAPAAAAVIAILGVAAASACWLASLPRRGDLLLVATAAWLLPVWVGVASAPAALRALALAGVVVVLAPLLHALLGGGRGVAAIYAFTGGLVVLGAVWFDPFLDIRCSVDCAHSGLAIAADAASEGFVRSVGAWAPVGIAGLGLALARRRAGRAVVVATAGLLVATIARALAIHAEPTDDPSLAGNRVALALAVAATLGAFAVTAQPALRILRGRRAVGLLVERLGDLEGAGDVESALAAAEGSPTLGIAYRGPSGWIDARGNAADAPLQGSTEIRVDGKTIAAITGIADDRNLGPTLRLGIANERLRAVALARLADVRASRERIVEANDAERRTLERNLHDGAQQSILALSFELRRARSHALGKRAEELDRAIAETELALAELRDLAHGIFPAILSEAGLDAALHALADAARIPIVVTCTVPERLPLQVEMAAYRVAAEAIEHGEASGTVSEMDIAAESADDLVVRVSYDGAAVTSVDSDEFVDAADRVAALGGTVTVRRDWSTMTELVAVIPCAS
jgi:signal transduction histidine kinase